jgi:formylglycine-generating enzyme required for sulfatase activity
MKVPRCAPRGWLAALVFLPACADIIAAGDLHRVDCVDPCEGATVGSGGRSSAAATTTGDASIDARTTSGGGGSSGASGAGGASDSGNEEGSVGATGAGGSSDTDGSAGAGGAGGTGGAGGSGGGPGTVCPAGGWPPGWVCVNPGTFTMGSPQGEIGRYPEERQHMVTMTRPFWMQATEVTQGQWQSAMGNNPAIHKGCGSNCPVEAVSWFDGVLYANALSTRDGLTPCYEKPSGGVFDANAAAAKVAPTWRLGLDCPGYRLPTEAEWEYTARAGTTTGFFSGDPSTTMCSPLDAALDVAGWYCANSGNNTHAPGTKRANAWGIYDMHGNVWEWVWDWAAPYGTAPVTDPIGPSSGTQREARGGSFYAAPYSCRSALRGPGVPDSTYNDTGFRLARSIP